GAVPRRASRPAPPDRPISSDRDHDAAPGASATLRPGIGRRSAGCPKGGIEVSVRARTSVMPWWLFLVTGVAWLLISLIVLRFDVTSIAAVGVLLGVIFLMAGANEVLITFAQASSR